MLPIINEDYKEYIRKEDHARNYDSNCTSDVKIRDNCYGWYDNCGNMTVIYDPSYML